MAKKRGMWLFNYHNALERDKKAQATLETMAAAVYEVMGEDIIDDWFVPPAHFADKPLAEGNTMLLTREISSEKAVRQGLAMQSIYDMPLGVVANMVSRSVFLAQGEAGPKLFERSTSASISDCSWMFPQGSAAPLLVDLHTRSYKALDANGVPFKVQALYIMPVCWPETNRFYYMVVGIGAKKLDQLARACFMVDADGHFDQEGTDRLNDALPMASNNSFMTTFPRDRSLEYGGFNCLCAVTRSINDISEVGESMRVYGSDATSAEVAMDASRAHAAYEAKCQRDAHVEEVRLAAEAFCGGGTDEELMVALYDAMVDMAKDMRCNEARIERLTQELDEQNAKAFDTMESEAVASANHARALAEERVIALEREIDEIKSEERTFMAEVDDYRDQVNVLGERIDELSQSRAVVDTMMLPTSCIESLELAGQLWGDRLVITEAARKSAQDFAQGDFREMFTHLQALAVVLWPIIFTEKANNPQAEFANRSNVEMTLKTNRRVKESMFDQEYTVHYKGKDVRMDPHTKGKDKKRGYAMRIHFFFDHEDKKIVIGHAGDHLRTTLTPRIH